MTSEQDEEDGFSRRQVLAMSVGGVGLVGFIGWDMHTRELAPSDEVRERCTTTQPLSFGGAIQTIEVGLGNDEGIMRVIVTVEPSDRSRHVDVFVNGESHTTAIPPSPDSVNAEFEFCGKVAVLDDGCVEGVGRPDFTAQLRQKDTVQDRVGFTVEESDSGWDLYQHCYDLVALEDSNAQ